MASCPAAAPVISVVIPTRNRAGSLGRTLQALVRQTLPGERFEVIVVSDGGGDETEAAVVRLAPLLPNLRFLAQPPRGPAAARNRGLGAARGEIVAFTDDDCRPEREWLRNLLDCFAANPEALGVEGRTTTEEEKLTPLTHQVVNLHGGYSRPTCNIAYRREALVEVGGFDEAYVFNGEDEDLALAVGERGAIVFCERARVVHPPRRLGLGEHLRRMVRLELQAMLSQFRLARKHPRSYRRLRRGGPWWSIFYVTARLRLYQLWRERGWLRRAPLLWLAALLLLGVRISYRLCLAPLVCAKLRSGRRDRGSRPLPAGGARAAPSR
jgi:glycosyltransferase involved in cell wall biosynthesis